MEGFVKEISTQALKPPVTHVGVIGWVSANLFNGVFNSVLTIVTLFFLWITVPPLLQWAFVDSLWMTTGAACREASGACWSIIWANFRFIIFGFYPAELQWRPLVAMLLLFGLLFYSRNRDQ